MSQGGHMFLQLLKSKTEEEQELTRLISQLPDDLSVVGRGTIVIKPKAVFDSPEFKTAVEFATKIVKR